MTSFCVELGAQAGELLRVFGDFVGGAGFAFADPLFVVESGGGRVRGVSEWEGRGEGPFAMLFLEAVDVVVLRLEGVSIDSA